MIVRKFTFSTLLKIFPSIKGLVCFQRSDQVLNLHTLGGTAAIGTASGTSVSEPAGTLNKMQIIVISPVLDVILPDQVHRADQLHALEFVL